MSDSSRSDDSVPSLSSYPPAFVSLIETFIKRAEEAEIRAHKALVIIKAKDDQTLQLQQRMDVLEKIASRLEEVMVPPLEIPKSPSSSGDLNSCHPRDLRTKQSENPPLQTLYERFPTAPGNRDSSCSKEVHNCYEKCQHLIDGLERSNCQLREALTAESQQRMKDHEQYVETLKKVAQAVKELHTRKNPNENLNLHSINSLLREQKIPQNIVDEIVAFFHLSVDSDMLYDACSVNNIKSTVNSNGLSSENREKFVKKMNIAKKIISTLTTPFENARNKPAKIMKSKGLKKSTYALASKGSLSSYHTPKSSSSMIIKPKYSSTLHFLNVLKRKNKQLKMKYQHICEKFTESLHVCQKLQKALSGPRYKNKIMLQNLNKSDKEIQTEECIQLSYSKEKTQGPRSVNRLQGRLDAAAKVMAKQCKQLHELQKQFAESSGQVEGLKKRLARAEALVASKDLLYETSQKQLQESENKCLALTQELKHTKESLDRFRQEITLKNEEQIRMRKEKEKSEASLEDMKKTLESKLLSLSRALHEKEEMNVRITSEVETKLNSIREQFLAQVTEASDRLVEADSKIQELYLGIETFLKLLFSLNSPELSPSSQAQAVLMASDILQLPPVQVQTILHSSRCDNHRVNRWMRECNSLVHEKVFAKNLGHLLLEAVLEARVT